MIPTFREYVSAPLTRPLRPVEEDVCRQALRREGVSTVPTRGRHGVHPDPTHPSRTHEESWFAGLIGFACGAITVVTLLWLASGMTS